MRVIRGIWLSVAGTVNLKENSVGLRLMNLFARSRPTSVFAAGSMAVNFINFEYDGMKSDILDNAFVTVTYENGIQASLNLCMFSLIFYEELILCGDEGWLKTFRKTDFLPEPSTKTYLEIKRGETKPSRVSSYPAYIEDSGHRGATYFEHIYFIDKIEGRETNAAIIEEGLWSIVVGVAAKESVQSGKLVNIIELLEKYGITID